MEEPDKNKLNTKPDPNLFARAIKGGWWVLGSRATQQVMAFARGIVLARLLSPDDFGLLALALLTISFLNQFSATGFNVALVQKQSNIESYLNSVWTFGIIRGVILYCILFLIAPLIAVFFESPDVTLIIRVIGLSAILTSFNNIGTIFFQKELDFKSQFFFINLGTLTDVTVAITLAVIYRTVWALIAGQLTGMFVRCILSYVLHSYRPSLQLDRNKIKDMWNYGKHIMVTSMLKFFCLEGDDIFLGKVMGTHALGLYRYAYKISNMVATDIGNMVSSVTFPTYSKLQNNVEKLKAGYIKSSQVVMLIVCPISGGMIVLANELILVIYGHQWLEMASAMQILCLLGIAKTNQAGIVLLSMNRPDIGKWLTVLRLAVIALSIYPLTKYYGMAGTAVSVTFSSALTLPFLQFYTKKLIGYPARDYIKLISFPILATVLMMWVVLFSRLFITEINILTLTFLVAVGVISYCFFILILARFYKEYKLAEIARDLIGGLK